MAALDNLDLATQAREPDGISYTCAAIRYPGHRIAVTNMGERDPDSFPRQGYEGLRVDRRVARPEGDKNFQRGLTFEWLVPTGHWVAVSDGGLDNWLSCGFSPDEVQPRVLGSNQRYTHENPQFDTLVDRGRFGPCENDGVKGAEHSDPREPLEDHHWG